MRTEIILAASPQRTVAGPILLLPEPVSFWGGVDAATGVIIDGHSSKRGRSVAHTVLTITELRGSSSTSAVLLELVYRGVAPGAILLAEIDAILLLGVITGREMGWRTPAILRIPKSDLVRLQDDSFVEIDAFGCLRLRPPAGGAR
jgi:uncharacterized protein